VILGQAGLHIGFDRSGLIELWDQIPAHLRPEAVDTTRGVATVFPALTLALIRLHQGDRAAAEAAYALAGPVRSWTPYRRCAWRPGRTGLRSPSASAGRRTSSSWRRGSSRSAASTSRTAPGPGSTWARSSCRSDRRPPRWAAWTRRSDDLRTAASICDANGARGYAVQARVELAAALTRRQAPGDRDEALAALAAAAREAEQLGMVPFTEWIGQLQARLTAAWPATHRSAPASSRWPGWSGGD
jgi:hypothetical protein